MCSAEFLPNIPPQALLQPKEHTVAKDDIDPEEIDEDIDIDGDDDLDILDDDDLDDDLIDDEDDGDDDEDDDDSTVGTTVVRKGSDDDEDDDDMVAPDDVEEDLAEILKDRLATEEVPDEDEETPDTDDRASGDDALQPKRADEVLCGTCFMLVRKNAPTCPMGDDACPVVKK